MGKGTGKGEGAGKGAGKGRGGYMDLFVRSRRSPRALFAPHAWLKVYRLYSVYQAWVPPWGSLFRFGSRG